MSTTAPALESYAARLDAIPLSRFHWRLLLLSGLGWMFDAMDILIVGSVIAAVSRAWELDATTALWISSINLLGLFVGATAAGMLSDRVGRKAMFQATLLIYSLFTGLSAFAFNAASLMLLRFLAGIGLGGELPVASTLLAEFAPSKRRGALVVLLESFWAYGSVAAALIGYRVIPQQFGALDGWQVALLIGALPAFLIFALRRGMPESVRFLVSKGRLEEAEAIVRQVERESGVGERGRVDLTREASLQRRLSQPPSLPGKGEQAQTRSSLAPPSRAGKGAGGLGPLRDLFAGPYARRTIVLWSMWATMNFSYYGIFLWLPLQFVRKGFSLDDALLFNLIIAVAQVPGYFAAAFLVERWGRKSTLVLFLTLCAVGAFFFGQVARQPQLGPQDIGPILLWGCVISFFNLGAWGVVYTYTPELYPTRLRGTGAGAAAAFGRLWAIIAPLSISWQLSLLGSDATVFFVFTGIMLLGALIVLALGEETRGRSLEEIAGA